jgi:2-polyprenyl-6-methoxyphenol hydroxylase-like FAD-dependent oxidoreductase
MTDSADVIVVGARCAGSSLAIQLARAGLQVIVVDKATFPSDTPSTHFFQAEALAVLQRLGVVDRLLATGAPALTHFSGVIDAVSFDGPWPQRPGDLGGGMCVRRRVLDGILVDAARDSGVDVRSGTILRSLVHEAGRVVGVEVERDSRHMTLRAPLVVGADGAHSTVAKSVGSRRYHETESPRIYVWGYFEGTRVQAHPRNHFYRQGDDLVVGAPCDNGAFMLMAGVDRARFGPEFGRDSAAMFAATVAAVPQAAALIEGATRQGRLQTVARYDGFMRESAGRGWVLLGDAGHFKDPAAGQGISDALRQSERLAPIIVDGIRGRRNLDVGLRDWWAWRDEDAFAAHWFASDIGRAGNVSSVAAEIIRSLVATPTGHDQFLDVFSHRVPLSQVLTPTRMLCATCRLLVRRSSNRRRVLCDVRLLVGDELRRRRLRKHPSYREANRLHGNH